MPTTTGFIMFKDGRPPMVVGGSRSTDEIYFEGSSLRVKDTDGFIKIYEDLVLQGQTTFLAKNLDNGPDVDIITIIDDCDYEVELSLPKWASDWVNKNAQDVEGIAHIWWDEFYFIAIKQK